MGNAQTGAIKRDQTVTEYGIFAYPSTEQGRAEIALKSGTIDARLLEHLIASCECLRCPEAALPGLGFRPCVDYKSLPRHVYFEGYFHGLPVGKPFMSMNPRIGVDMEKPAAPRALRAFYEAMRRRNTEHLCEALDREGKSIFVQSLRKLMAEGRAFADIAIQIHAGQAVSEQHVSYHVDASNSILHLALAIQGSRALHSFRSKTPEEDPQQVVEWQQPGDVYVSSPAFFRHGVQYPQAYSWSKRCIAIQARILYTQAEWMELEVAKAHQSDPEAFEWLAAFSRALASRPVVLPSFEEVNAIEAELADEASN